MKTLFLDKKYTRLNKDPTNTIAEKIKTLIIKKATFLAKLNQHENSQIFSLRLYDLSKIHNSSDQLLAL